MLPLEDGYGDIIGKAMRGLGVMDLDLSQATKLSIAEVRAARGGEFDEHAASKIAKALNLNPAALLESGSKNWYPHAANILGVYQLTSPFGGDMTVNCYIIWDPANGEAALFDTGTHPSTILNFLDEKKLSLKYIFITHTHGDHIDCLPQVQIASGAPTFVHKNGDIGGVKLFDWGDKFQFGTLTVETRQTTGHAADGTTFVISGLEKTVAVVGDAVFAGSMGGGAVSYREALTTNLQNIYSLPDDTLLCPGHGPLTTIALEKIHNPFYYPGSK
ncbi:MAG: MBL fold metallo-hydrolase [Verrucomicrobiales bacterium]|jgi:glyoxylase-like metal-dependent hydrolase (beta-lactamase superfamily II)|nr:MBL fold metallo-hydrolase [Verrucomicrobiales bacterium]